MTINNISRYTIFTDDMHIFSILELSHDYELPPKKYQKIDVIEKSFTSRRILYDVYLFYRLSPAEL